MSMRSQDAIYGMLAYSSAINRIPGVVGCRVDHDRYCLLIFIDDPTQEEGIRQILKDNLPIGLVSEFMCLDGYDRPEEFA